jgi:N utilization substance protein B
VSTARDAPGRGRGGRAGEGRRAGREAALQMLYQWEIGRTPIDEVVARFWDIDRPDVPAPPARVRQFADVLATGTVGHVEEIDQLIAATAQHWRISRMATLDRAILRLAVFEFLHMPETPRKAVINEALELARTFSADDAVRFVNGMLDAIMRRLEDAGSAPGSDSADGT